MRKILRYFDISSIIVIFLTLMLFIAALYFTGLTHDILLEAGVFLVSVKLIFMSYRNKIIGDSLHKELSEIRSLLQNISSQSPSKNEL